MSHPEFSSIPALVIGGPTASGKSALALELASCIGGEIINADAFQLYAGLSLLTAQPSPAELAKLPHHLFGEISLSETFDAARFRAVALERIAECRSRGRPPILVGGTGMYLKAILYGLSSGLPGPEPKLRASLEARGLEELRAELLLRDPSAAHSIDLLNPRRVIRALEVCILTGNPFTSFRDRAAWQGPCVGIWIQLPRDVLHRRIAQRASRLFAEGVEQEVRDALPALGPTASQAIGIQAISDVISGRLSPREAEVLICTATRQYARRQETWFRKEAALQQVDPDAALETAIRLLR